MSHNGSNYGFHLIIKQLAKDFNGLFSCLGENTEKYITFSISIFKKTCYNEKPIAYQIKFIDSYRHMDKSLSILVDNLAELNNIEKFKLLLRKGIYPYEYMSSWERFKEPVPLTKESYCSELNDESISDSDLVHVKNICDAFNITNLSDYHDLYVSLDVALLADVFENFRDTTINIDKLDPAYYLSPPALSWHSCMKKTGVKLELITDENMLLLFEKGIRGGTCNVIHKYARANNKYMKKYDITKESIFLAYLDVSNLYGWAMSEKLPVDNFKWETDLSIFTMDFIKNYNEESDTGYLLYVDVEYPKNLRKSHEDLPFLPNRMKVNKVNKIICNQYDKHKYSGHIYALKQALNHGFILKNVHTVISFRQKAWLKPYIDINTELRMNAKNEFEKDYFKLKKNTTYGKTMENIRKHRDIRLVTKDKKISILASEPNYEANKHISKDLLIMEMKKRNLYMNKPVHLGQAILDISKSLM